MALESSKPIVGSEFVAAQPLSAQEKFRRPAVAPAILGRRTRKGTGHPWEAGAGEESMEPTVANLSEGDMIALAAYIASLKP
jgi:hypothetical protein